MSPIASTILDRLHDFEITLGLISSRLASRGFSDQFLEDINELTRALRFLHASYLSRHNDESVAEPRNEPLFQLDCPVEYTGQAGRPRYTVDKGLVERLRRESFKWVDIYTSYNGCQSVLVENIGFASVPWSRHFSVKKIWRRSSGHRSTN